MSDRQWICGRGRTQTVSLRRHTKISRSFVFQTFGLLWSWKANAQLRRSSRQCWRQSFRYWDIICLSKLKEPFFLYLYSVALHTSCSPSPSSAPRLFRVKLFHIVVTLSSTGINSSAEQFRGWCLVVLTAREKQEADPVKRSVRAESPHEITVSLYIVREVAGCLLSATSTALSSIQALGISD